jgi:sugar phosphate permease
MKDKQTQNKEHVGFNYQSMFLLCLAYLLYGMLRKTVPVTTSLLIENLSFSKTDIGLISATFGVGFGLSKLIGGFLCDIYSCRKILALGLYTASMMSILFLLIQPDMKICYRLAWFWHGFAQGVGWPSIASLIYDNFDVIGRGTVWSLISSVR